MNPDDLAVALRDAFEKTHPTEHVAFEDPDTPVTGEINGWFDLTEIARHILKAGGPGA